MIELLLHHTNCFQIEFLRPVYVQGDCPVIDVIR